MFHVPVHHIDGWLSAVVPYGDTESVNQNPVCVKLLARIVGDPPADQIRFVLGASELRACLLVPFAFG